MKAPFGSKAAEYKRTAEMLVEIAEEQGVFFSVALLIDIGYTREEMKEVLVWLQDTPGSRKS